MVAVVVPELVTERLRLRAWRVEDAEAALALFGDERVVRWLSPAMGRVSGPEDMRAVLGRWAAESAGAEPVGRWAVEELAGGRLVGAVALRPLPPAAEDLELSYQVLPSEQGRGLATEAAGRVVRQAFADGVPELFVVARPANGAGTAVARRLGFQWVGETSKYYDLRLQVFRLRPGDLA